MQDQVLEMETPQGWSEPKVASKETGDGGIWGTGDGGIWGTGDGGIWETGDYGLYCLYCF